MPTKAEVFAAYDGDVDAILEAWPNVDPVGYAEWERTALVRLLRSDVGAWQRRQCVRVDREPKAETGQGRLEGVPLPVRRKSVRMRARVTTDKGPREFLTLSGKAGAKVLREVAGRDKPGAATTLARCERLLRIAEMIESETKRLGRPVSVAEVIERVAA
jgi:hypothetical protein